MSRMVSDTLTQHFIETWDLKVRALTSMDADDVMAELAAHSRADLEAFCFALLVLVSYGQDPADPDA